MASYTGGANYGGGAFGTNVAQIAMPNPAQDLAKQFPNLAGANTGVSNVINNDLMGRLNPDTVDMIKNAGAAWGVNSGMPGSGLAVNNSVRNLGLASQDIQHQGIQSYNQTLPTIKSTQTVSPETQADINLQNAVNAAAPNPAAAASYSQQLFQQYLNRLNPSQKTSSYFTPAGVSDSSARSGVYNYMQ